MNRSALVALFVGSLIPISSAAQARRNACFPARPAAACRSFFVFEMGLGTTIAQASSTYGTGPDLSWQAGWMWYRGTAAAIGGTIYIARNFSSDRTRVALLSRYQRRIGGRATAAIGVGPALELGNFNGSIIVKSAGSVAELSLGWDNQIAFATQVEFLPSLEARPGVYWHAGIKLGSYPGLVSAAATGVGFAVSKLSRVLNWKE